MEESPIRFFGAQEAGCIVGTEDALGSEDVRAECNQFRHPGVQSIIHADGVPQLRFDQDDVQGE